MEPEKLTKNPPFLIKIGLEEEKIRTNTNWSYDPDKAELLSKKILGKHLESKEIPEWWVNVLPLWDSTGNLADPLSILASYAKVMTIENYNSICESVVKIIENDPFVDR